MTECEFESRLDVCAELQAACVSLVPVISTLFFITFVVCCVDKKSVSEILHYGCLGYLNA